MVDISKSVLIIVNLALIVNWCYADDAPPAGGTCVKTTDCGENSVCKDGSCVKWRTVLPCKQDGAYCGQVIFTCCPGFQCQSSKCVAKGGGGADAAPDASRHNKKKDKPKGRNPKAKDSKDKKRKAKNMSGLYGFESCSTYRQQCYLDNDCCNGFCRRYNHYYSYCALTIQ